MEYTVKVSTDEPRLAAIIEDALKVAIDVVWDTADVPDGMTELDLDQAIDGTSIVVTDEAGRIVAER